MFTQDDISKGLAVRDEFAARIGEQTYELFRQFIRAAGEAQDLFEQIRASVEFENAEAFGIERAFTDIENAVFSHGARVAGYQEGMGEAIEAINGNNADTLRALIARIATAGTGGTW